MEAKLDIYDEIKAERLSQIKKGWGLEHDDMLVNGQLACAASAYAIEKKELYPSGWVYKEAPKRKQLIKAAALIVAEIERLDRLNGNMAESMKQIGRL